MLIQKIFILLQIVRTFCNVNFTHHRRLADLDGKIPTDGALFSWVHASPVQCVLSCTIASGCSSVFLSDGVCLGYSEIYDINSVNLIEQTGVVYYVMQTEEAFDSAACALINYAWDKELSICYKVHRRKKAILDAKAQCLYDNPRSRVLRADSDTMYNFLLETIASNHIGSVYVQGTRASGSDFIGEDGRPITYFRWGSRQPQTGDYLLVNEVTLLQETSSGLETFAYVCRVY